MPPRSKAKEEIKEYLHNQLPLIKVLKELTPRQARAILPYVSSDSHDALCLCVHNAIRNYKKLKEEDVKQLFEIMDPHMDKYRYLSDKRFTKSDKVFAHRANILEQTGEGLPFILSAILPMLTSLFAPK